MTYAPITTHIARGPRAAIVYNFNAELLSRGKWYLVVHSLTVYRVAGGSSQRIPATIHCNLVEKNVTLAYNSAPNANDTDGHLQPLHQVDLDLGPVGRDEFYLIHLPEVAPFEVNCARREITFSFSHSYDTNKNCNKGFDKALCLVHFSLYRDAW